MRKPRGVNGQKQNAASLARVRAGASDRHSAITIHLCRHLRHGYLTHSHSSFCLYLYGMGKKKDKTAGKEDSATSAFVNPFATSITRQCGLTHSVPPFLEECVRYLREHGTYRFFSLFSHLPLIVLRSSLSFRMQARIRKASSAFRAMQGVWS